MYLPAQALVFSSVEMEAEIPSETPVDFYRNFNVFQLKKRTLLQYAISSRQIQ
jgi:hypothetical protein